MSEKNPFTILGFAQSAFHGLSDQDIRGLVKAQYRALAGVHHPDRHGNTERFKEVQDAFDKLSEDFEFDFWKKLFLRKRKDQVAELEKERRHATAEMAALHRGLVEFWLALCRGSEIFQRSSFGRGEFVRDMPEMEGFSIFNPPPVSIMMMDRLSEMLRTQASQERRKAGAWPTPYYHNRNTGCFELQISSEGVMTRQELVKTHFDTREKWRPKVRQEWIEFRAHPSPAHSYYWKPEGESTPVAGILIGSFPTKVLSNNRVMQNPDIKGLISGEMKFEDYQILERGYSLDEFEPYLRTVRPRVMGHHLMVIAEGTEEHNLRFKILGYARKILALKEKES